MLRSKETEAAYSMAALTAVVLGIYFSSHYSYLLFHALVEIVTVAIAFALFVLTWNTRSYLKNNYLWLLGIGYGFVALIDLLHALAYKGMNIFPGYGANLPTQLWITARYLQAVILCVAPFFVGRRVDNRVVFGGYATAVSALVVMVYSGNFPDCFVEGKGLTVFKISSEYVISILLLASLYLLYGKRKQLNDRVFFLIASSIACTILSEISFTAYVSVYGFANLVGHIAKLAAFYLVYRAILVTGLKEPFEVVFRTLKQTEQELEQRVAERTSELQRINEQARRFNRELRAISNCNQVLMRAVDEQTLLNDICHIVCDEAGYRMAWVGYAEDDENKTVRTVAQAGVEDGYLAVANITWADTAYGHGPTGNAIRSGKSACSADIATDSSVAPWRKQALQRGYRSSLALPLKDENSRVFGALTIYSTEPNAFPPEEIRLMEELAGDLSFGIAVLRERIERKQAEQSLRQSEENYRTLIQKLQAAVVVHAADTRIITSNPVAQSLLGLTEDQLMGKTAMDPTWHFFREDGTLMPLEEYPVNQVTATRQPIRNLLLGVHRPGDAQDVWCMVNANPVFGPDGQITEIIVTFIDITERKLAQERLAHLAAIVESTDDAIIGKTLDERILSWNRGAEQIYGYTAAEIVGRPISTLVTPGLQEELNQITAKLKRGERVEHLETMRVRKDGKHIHVALTISPIRDARGQIIGASTIARDITERKRMEDALVFVAQRSWQTGAKNFFAALAQFLGEKLDMDYVLIDRIDENPNMAETVALYAKGALIPNLRYALKGTPCENVMGRCLCVYPRGIQKLFPEDTLLPGMGVESYVGIPLWDSTGRPIGLIAVMGSKPLQDDAPVTQLLQLVAIRASAELERKNAEEEIRKLNSELEQRVAERTRELAASEERMRLFFERQLMGSAITSPEKGWLQVNDKLCQMLGYSREELSKLTWAELTHPEDLAAELTQFERLLRGEIESYTIEKRFVRKDGSIVFTNLAVGCVRRPDRSVDYLLALVEDITERKRAEANIQQLNKELRQRAASLEVANKGLESFSYSVSHDLRAPLRSIDGFSRVLLEDYADKLDRDGKDSLNRIRAASQRMGALIDDLLTLAQVSRGEMNHQLVDLSALAATVAEWLRQTSPERRIEFVIEPNLLATGDARLLQIVFENLFGNACKFSSAQPVARIEFGRTVCEGEPAYFVRDNGAGFDAASAKKLFGAFQRFHSTEEFPGTGIGLATVQRIVHRHGGSIWAESEPNHGATFYFTLFSQPRENRIENKPILLVEDAQDKVQSSSPCPTDY